MLYQIWTILLLVFVKSDCCTQESYSAILTKLFIHEFIVIMTFQHSFFQNFIEKFAWFDFHIMKEKRSLTIHGYHNIVVWKIHWVPNAFLIHSDCIVFENWKRDDFCFLTRKMREIIRWFYYFLGRLWSDCGLWNGGPGTVPLVTWLDWMTSTKILWYLFSYLFIVQTITEDTNCSIVVYVFYGRSYDAIDLEVIFLCAIGCSMSEILTAKIVTTTAISNPLAILRHNKYIEY